MTETGKLVEDTFLTDEDRQAGKKINLILDQSQVHTEAALAKCEHTLPMFLPTPYLTGYIQPLDVCNFRILVFRIFTN